MGWELVSNGKWLRETCIASQSSYSLLLQTTPTREPQKSKDQKTRSNATGDKDREDRRQDPTQKKDRGEGKKRTCALPREEEAS